MPAMCALLEMSAALLHHRLLVRRLDLAQVRDHRPAVDEGDVQEAVAGLGGELVGRRQRRRGRRTRTERQGQPGAVGADGVEERVELVGHLVALAAVHLPVEHRGDEGLELAGVVDGRDAALRRGLFLGEDVAVPVLAPRIGLADEQDLLARAVAGHQHEDGLLLGHAGQIEQVAVLAELVVDVERVDPGRGAPHDGQRLGAELLHQPRPPRRQVVLEGTGGATAAVASTPTTAPAIPRLRPAMGPPADVRSHPSRADGRSVYTPRRSSLRSAPTRSRRTAHEEAHNYIRSGCLRHGGVRRSAGESDDSGRTDKASRSRAAGRRRTRRQRRAAGQAGGA